MLAPASAADIPAVVALRDEAARWMIGRGIRQWRPGDRPLSYFENAARTGELFVWREDGAVLGAVVAARTDPAWEVAEPWTRYLHTLVIDPAYAGIGLGRRILAAIESHLRSTGVSQVRLDCVADNARLRAYYRDAGYTEVGTRDLPRPWGSLALFEKSLGG